MPTSQQSQDNSGHVYLIHADGSNGLYKIGLAKYGRLSDRLKELNRGQSPFPLKLIHSIDVGDRFKVEKWLHNYFNEYRHHGEWFTFSENTTDINHVVAVYNYAAQHFPIMVSEPEPTYQTTFQPTYTSDDEEATFSGVVIGGIFAVIGIIMMFVLSTLSNSNLQRVRTLAPNQGNSVERITKTNGTIQVSQVSNPNYNAANLRSTPNGTIIGAVHNGSRIALGKVSSDGQWQYITTQDGRNGWVWAEFIQRDL